MRFTIIIGSVFIKFTQFLQTIVVKCLTKEQLEINLGINVASKDTETY